jgi:DNA polymerase epsilon subunit 1
MVELARNNTQVLAEYSVSDAVATYFLYKKHIHDFIFALCTIIPMFSDEVLRKGSGTLCEHLLMAQAYQSEIVFPNKKREEAERFHRGHLLDSETYIGGKVECLRSGVYRGDIPERFVFAPQAFTQLIESVDSLLAFYAHEELHCGVEEIANYEELRAQLVAQLDTLAHVPNPESHEALPLIYHLDVAAMYPNIILTNRL